MADRPILFSGPMVRALLAGTKTQTRRILKPQPSAYTGNPIPPEGRSWTSKKRDEPYFAMHDDQIHWCWWDEYNRQGPDWIKLRIAKGDRLWVREAHALLPRTAYRASVGTGTIEQVEHPTDGYTAAVFREGFDRSGRPLWRPSIHMPRWASRLTLTVTDVRVHRLADMSDDDIRAEGITDTETSWLHAWHELWASINGEPSWEANPFVAAYTFTVQQGNIDVQV